MIFEILGASQDDYCFCMEQKMEHINELDIGYIGVHYTTCPYSEHQSTGFGKHRNI